MGSSALRALLPAVLIITGLNLLAHFLPFERVALSGDDIRCLLIPRQERLDFVLGYLTTVLRRPLEVSFVILHWIMGEHKALWVLPVFLSSSLLAVAVYFLVRRLVGDPALSLVCAAVYVLLPNKEQLYHNLCYTHANLVLALSVAAFCLFLGYLEESKRWRLWLSVACYAVTIFWYELGFFLPLVLVVAVLFYGRHRWRACLLFLLPVGLNILWRSGLLTGRSLYFETICRPDVWEDLLQDGSSLYFGRQMAKAVLYGLARFPHIEQPWLACIAAADLALLWGVFRWLRGRELPPVSLRALPVSAVMMPLFLLPAAMGYGILNRHTPLASIGFSILVVAGLLALPVSRRRLSLGVTLLAAAGLVISQGLAWSQVVSCRMNDALLETLQEKRGELMRTERVLFDQYDLARNIPYTWVKDPLNQLDTYWGVNGLPGDSFQSLVVWVTGRGLSTEVVRSELRREGEWLAYDIYDPHSSRFIAKRQPLRGTFVIDYRAVYPRGFRNGKR